MRTITQSPLGLHNILVCEVYDKSIIMLLFRITALENMSHTHRSHPIQVSRGVQCPFIRTISVNLHIIRFATILRFCHIRGLR